MTLIASAHLTSDKGYEQHIRVGRHELVADEPESHGGHDMGPPPFGLVLSGLAACTSITLTMYAERKTWELGPMRVDVRLLEEDKQLRVERVITFDARVDGEQRAKLLEIAEKTPVTKALKAGFGIETRLG